MRLLAVFALVLVGIVCVQGQLVVPQINNVDLILSLLPQLQNFVGQLDKILPQLVNVLSSVEIQSLKDKIVQVVLSQLGGNLDLNAIKDKIRPILQQFLGSKQQGRFDIDAVLQQVAQAITSALPGLLIGLIGKREAVDARAGLDDLLALVNKLQLNTVIPQIQQFLNSAQLQQLQNQFFTTVVTAVGNNWNVATLAQALKQLVTSFVPQATQMRIDWEQIGQAALDGLVTAIPGVLIGLVSLIGKRDLGLNYQQLLAQLPVDKFAQIIQLVNSANKATVLAKLRNFLQQFFSAYQGRINFDDLASNLLNHLNNLLPTLSQSIFQTLLG
jgi:uncharacterized membrane protein YqhA